MNIIVSYNLIIYKLLEEPGKAQDPIRFQFTTIEKCKTFALEFINANNDISMFEIQEEVKTENQNKKTGKISIEITRVIINRILVKQETFSNIDISICSNYISKIQW